MPEKQFIEKFKTFIRDEGLFSPAQPVLLAVSGGADSVVMTTLFRECGFNFGIAHCNFQLRGADSDKDAEFVQELAEKLNLPFYSETFDTVAYRKQHQLSLEEAARDLRYTWLEKIRTEFQYDHIATAHHLNDSMETVILNMVKGTGIRGLTGIATENNKIIRPLLFATRQEIETYAQANDIIFRTDTTNFENDFTRNKIRNQVVPLLKEINPSLEHTFQKNSRHFAETELLFSEQVNRKLRKIIIQKHNDRYIPIATLKNLPAVSTYLHELLFQYGFNSDQVEQMIGCFNESGKVFYSNTHRVIIDRKYFILTAKENEMDSSIVIKKENRNISFSNDKLVLKTGKYKPGMQFNDSGRIAYFDADNITFPLMLRRWQKGDYLYPLGLKKKHSDKPGKKKVSDLLTDLKLDLLQKENTWVLLSGEKIIWVVGIRQDERVKVDAATRNLLSIRLS